MTEQSVGAEAERLTALYQARERKFRAEAEREAVQSRLLSRIRIGLFALMVLCAAVASTSPTWRGLALYTFPVAIGIFIVVAVIHARVERRRTHQSALADLNLESQDRIARRWAKLPSHRSRSRMIIRMPAIWI